MHPPHLFKKGVSGNPKGKPKGATTKYKIDVYKLCVENNFDPVLNIMKIERETSDMVLKFNCNKEILQYVAQKLKAVEHTIQENNHEQALAELK
jgi:hypothetical protein